MVCMSVWFRIGLSRYTVERLGASNPVGHRHPDAFLKQAISLAIGLLEQHRRAVAGQFIEGGSVGLSRSNAARSRATNTTSPLVSRCNVPAALKVSSDADDTCQPLSANNPMAGCSTSWSSV
jgi:hypothetical protein